MLVRLACSLLFFSSVQLEDSFNFPAKRQAQSESRNTGYVFVQVGPNGYYEQAPAYQNNRYNANLQGQFAPQYRQPTPPQTFSRVDPTAPEYVSERQPQTGQNIPTSQPKEQVTNPPEVGETKAYLVGQSEAAESSSTSQNIPAAKACFVNEFGYRCCSEELQRFMVQELDHPQKSEYYRGCNVQKATTVLQTEGQMRYNVSFEVRVGPSDSAGKGKFLGKWMCKVRSRQGKIAVMYAHPNQYTLDSGRSRPLSAQEFQNRVRNNGWGPEDLIETEFGMENIFV